MSPLGLALTSFGCTFGGALVGMGLRSLLPSHHVQPESQSMVNTSIGLVAAMTALVLGLVTASAQETYSATSTELKHTATTMLALDRALAQFGPEAQPVRAELRRIAVGRYEALWGVTPRSIEQMVGSDPAVAERLALMTRTLPSSSDVQRELRSRAVTLAEQMLSARWTLLTDAGARVPAALLAILVIWLAGTFVSFGLFAPRNLTVVATLAFAAFAVSCALFLVLELNSPLSGLVKVSGEPMRQAIELLGK
jgi:hypothetical protein